MLDVLLEQFDAFFVTDAKKSIISDCLKHEAAALQDDRHLVQNVIGSTEFEWEFASIGPGFLDLVKPFMGTDSGSSYLFLDALKSLGLDNPAYNKGILFLEYANFALLVNDYYNFHSLFVPNEVDMLDAARLTQLRYAGQYLNTYPRYLLVTNALDVDDATLVRLHRWLANIYATSGMGHGVLVKWSHAHFANVRLEHYLQNAIDLLCTYILFPVALAAILAGMPEPQLRELKAACGWLTLFTKLRCERKCLCGTLSLKPDAYREKALIPITLPGYAFIRKELRLDALRFAHLRFPDIGLQANMMTDALAREDNTALCQEMMAREQDCFTQFMQGIEKAGVLRDMAVVIAKAFNMDAEAR